MSYFIFNGVSSEDLGLMITKPVIRPTWKLEEKEFTLVGRSCKYHQKSNTYSDQTLTIETYLDEITTEKLRNIYKSLHGDGKLWFSSAPDELLNVTAYAPEPNPVAYMAGVFLLKFRVKPFAYAVNSTIVEINSENSYKSVTNNGTIFSEPEISFVSTANQDITINVNGADFVVTHPEACTYDSPIFIDCEEQIAYFMRPDNTAYTCTQFTTGDFPLLHTGENFVRYTGQIHDFKINVRERFL